jgi:hypothetical protein
MPFPQYCRPLAATGASREGSFVVRTNRHGCTRFLLARLGIGEASCRSKVGRCCPAHCASSPCGVYPYPPPLKAPRRGVRVGCRHVELAKLSKVRLRTGFPGLWVAIEASMSMPLPDDFDRPRARDILASRGSRVDTHYHIVTTFEAKESGALGVLMQSPSFFRCKNQTPLGTTIFLMLSLNGKSSMLSRTRGRTRLFIQNILGMVVDAVVLSAFLALSGCLSAFLSLPVCRPCPGRIGGKACLFLRVCLVFLLECGGHPREPWASRHENDWSGAAWRPIGFGRASRRIHHLLLFFFSVACIRILQVTYDCGKLRWILYS